LVISCAEKYGGKTGLWIRIRIGSGFRDFVDPDPYWESGSGSRGKKTKKISVEKMHFLVILKKNLPLKRKKSFFNKF
jgi:hypothetical protein